MCLGKLKMSFDMSIGGMSLRQLLKDFSKLLNCSLFFVQLQLEQAKQKARLISLWIFCKHLFNFLFSSVKTCEHKVHLCFYNANDKMCRLCTFCPGIALLSLSVFVFSKITKR